MNTQRLAQLRISPLHIQQGLFASLALLVTLVATQQFQHWDQHREATRLQQQPVHSALYTRVSAPLGHETALSFTPVDGQVAPNQLPQPQTWVF